MRETIIYCDHLCCERKVRIEKFKEFFWKTYKGKDFCPYHSYVDRRDDNGIWWNVCDPWPTFYRTGDEGNIILGEPFFP